MAKVATAEGKKYPIFGKYLLILNGSTMKYSTILLIAILSMSSSCKKEDMPSDGHKNIFRCKVNGVEWTPHCISDFFGCSAVDCQYYKEDKYLSLSAINRNQDKSIDQGFRFISRFTKSNISDIIYLSGEFVDYTNIEKCITYDLDTVKTRVIEIIQIDTINFRISGNFQFTVANDCSDTLDISEGYFDLEYRF